MRGGKISLISKTVNKIDVSQCGTALRVVWVPRSPTGGVRHRGSGTLLGSGLRGGAL